MHLVAFWRTHHPSQPTPQHTKPKSPYVPHIQNDNTTMNNNQPPQPTTKLFQHPVIPFPMPIMKVVKSPPMFSQNITIQRTNIKPAELTNMGGFIVPPHVLGN